VVIRVALQPEGHGARGYPVSIPLIRKKFIQEEVHSELNYQFFLSEDLAQPTAPLECLATLTS